MMGYDLYIILRWFSWKGLSGKKLKYESDDEKIAPIVMDTVRPAGRTVGM